MAARASRVEIQDAIGAVIVGMLADPKEYALNTEQYDIAQQLRNKLTEVEAEVIKQQEAKRGTSSKSEVQDKGLSIIHLRADLQSAIEGENYALDAELRDRIFNLEADSFAASANVAGDIFNL